MSTYIRAVVAAEAIADKHGIPLGDLVDTFADIPAADVAPVVHGRWQSYESSRYVGVDGKGNPKYRNIRIYYCSQCGHCSIIRTKGCPNCRAKMDETKEETDNE